MRNLSRLMLAIAALAIAYGTATPVDAEPRYRYVSLDAHLPAGFDFFDPVAVINDGRVYGNAYRCSGGGCVSSVAGRTGRTVGILAPGFARDANDHGVVGGYVITDPRNDLSRAALFCGRQVKLLTRQPDEVSSRVERLTETGIALVELETTDDFYAYVSQRGDAIRLDFGPNVGFSLFFDVNNAGVVSSTVYSLDANAYRAARLRPPARLALLGPRSTEPHAWGLGINSRGDVLGYSFEFGATERIGFWRGTMFHPRFVEGTAEFPTVSNSLLWNDRGLIVITDTTDAASYLVPRKNVRLNLADLTDRLPPWTLIVDVNDRGDLVGFGGRTRGQVEESFLLRRVADARGLAASARTAWRPEVASARTARQAAIAHGLLAKPARDAYRSLRQKHRAE